MGTRPDLLGHGNANEIASLRELRVTMEQPGGINRADLQAFFDSTLTEPDKTIIRRVFTGMDTGAINVNSQAHLLVTLYLNGLLNQDLVHATEHYRRTNGGAEPDWGVVCVDATSYDQFLADNILDDHGHAAPHLRHGRKFVNDVLDPKFGRVNVRKDVLDREVPPWEGPTGTDATSGSVKSKLVAYALTPTQEVAGIINKRTTLAAYIAWLQEFVTGLQMDLTSLPTATQTALTALFAAPTAVTPVGGAHPLDALFPRVSFVPDEDATITSLLTLRTAAINGTDTDGPFYEYEKKIEQLQRAARELGIAALPAPDKVALTNITKKLDTPPDTDDTIAKLRSAKSHTPLDPTVWIKPGQPRPKDDFREAAEAYQLAINKFHRIARAAGVTVNTVYATADKTEIDALNLGDVDTYLTDLKRDIDAAQKTRDANASAETNRLRTEIRTNHGAVTAASSAQHANSVAQIGRYAVPVAELLAAVKLKKTALATRTASPEKATPTAAIYYGMKQELADTGTTGDTAIMEAAASALLFTMTVNEPDHSGDPEPAPAGHGATAGASAWLHGARQNLGAVLSGQIRDDGNVLLRGIPLAKDLNLNSTVEEISRALDAFEHTPNITPEKLLDLQMQIAIEMIVYVRHLIDHRAHARTGGIQDSQVHTARGFIERLKGALIQRLLAKSTLDSTADEKLDEPKFAAKLDSNLAKYYTSKQAQDGHAMHHALSGRAVPPPPAGAHAAHHGAHGSLMSRIWSHTTAGVIGKLVDDMFFDRNKRHGGGGGGGH